MRVNAIWPKYRIFKICDQTTIRKVWDNHVSVIHSISGDSLFNINCKSTSLFFELRLFISLQLSTLTTWDWTDGVLDGQESEDIDADGTLDATSVTRITNGSRPTEWYKVSHRHGTRSPGLYYDPVYDPDVACLVDITWSYSRTSTKGTIPYIVYIQLLWSCCSEVNTRITNNDSYQYHTLLCIADWVMVISQLFSSVDLIIEA